MELAHTLGAVAPAAPTPTPAAHIRAPMLLLLLRVVVLLRVVHSTVGQVRRVWLLLLLLVWRGRVVHR